MEAAQLVPFGGVAGEIVLCGVLTRGADCGEVAAVFGAACGKGGVAFLGQSEQAGGGGTKRRRAAFSDGAAQEYPAAFFLPFGQASIAQDPNVARNPRLALPEDLCQFTHGQLHRRQQTHDPQPGWVGQSPQGGFDLHCRII